MKKLTGVEERGRHHHAGEENSPEGRSGCLSVLSVLATTQHAHHQDEHQEQRGHQKSDPAKRTKGLDNQQVIKKNTLLK